MSVNLPIFAYIRAALYFDFWDGLGFSLHLSGLLLLVFQIHKKPVSLQYLCVRVRVYVETLTQKMKLQWTKCLLLVSTWSFFLHNKNMQ